MIIMIRTMTATQCETRRAHSELTACDYKDQTVVQEVLKSTTAIPSGWPNKKGKMFLNTSVNFGIMFFLNMQTALTLCRRFRDNTYLLLGKEEYKDILFLKCICT
jgi:hypothetical protein